MLTICGDLHAKPDNLEQVETLFDMFEDLGHPVLFLGDTLDTKEVIRGRCLNTIYRRVSRSKLHFTFLIGNHCWFNLECKEHSLEALKSLPNVQIVDKPVSIKIDNVSCRLYPYIHDQQILRNDLQNLKNERIVFGHFDIRAFDYGNGIISEDGLDVEDFEGIQRVISGHYHKYQNVGRITYLGTPFSHSFGESNQLKYIAVYDIANDFEPELIETPFPKHVTHEVDCSVHSSWNWSPDDINRVILCGTQEEINRFQKADGVKYIERPTSDSKEAVVSETDSPEIQFTKWASEIKGYSKDVLNLGLEVLNDV